MDRQLKRITKKLFFLTFLPVQILLVYLSYYFCWVLYHFAIIEKRTKTVTIGVDEVARNIHFLGKTFPSAYTVCFTSNIFYKDKFDFGPYNRLLQLIAGPVLFGYLCNLSTTFLYIWNTGFLVDREWEFKYLKRKNKKIVCLFCGNDIRSLKLTKQFFDTRKEDTDVNYSANLNDPYYDNDKKKIAAVTDQFSDLILHWRIEVQSYLTKETHPWPYSIDFHEYDYHFDTYEAETGPVVLHAPSNPLTKGTPIVRAAVKKLKVEGYKFQYIELVGVGNEEVLKHLKHSHIVMNQLYMMVPGLFGVEAMATGNAVLMSADRNINTELPEDSSQAWLTTRYWEAYDNLKYLFDNKEVIEQYAMRGREFVERHYSIEIQQEYYREIFLDHNIPI